MRPTTRRWRHPALGQLAFRFLIDWLPIEPPRPPPAPSPPRPPERLPSLWWRRRRPATRRPVERSTARDGRIVDRWIRRGASCCLCKRWPAPYDRRVHGRLLLLCRSCQSKPDSSARIEEIIFTEWRASPESFAG
jgi:hypothetical protein